MREPETSFNLIFLCVLEKEQILKRAQPSSFVSWHPYLTDHFPSDWQLQKNYSQVGHTQCRNCSTFWFPKHYFFAMDSSQTFAYPQEKHGENGCILQIPACECKEFSLFISYLPTLCTWKKSPPKDQIFPGNHFQGKLCQHTHHQTGNPPDRRTWDIQQKLLWRKIMLFAGRFWTFCRKQYFLIFIPKNDVPKKWLEGRGNYFPYWEKGGGDKNLGPNQALETRN